MLITFVCTGNTCRSPMAEALFKEKIKGFDENCTVISCGLQAMTGDTAAENAVLVMKERGIDISSHRSTIISAYIIDMSDYIICMNEMQYGIVELAAGEKAVLLGNGIPDPYGCGPDTYRECADMISLELDRLLESDLFFTQDVMRFEDVSRVAEIENENFSSPLSEQGFTDEINKSYSMCYVVRFLDTVAGYICADVLPPDAYITTIAVDEKMRRRHVGDRLIKMMCDYCEYDDCDMLSLEVRESNIPARKLYESNGFKENGIRKGFYSKPSEDAVIMTKYFKDDTQ